MIDDRHEQAEQLLSEGHAVEDVALTVGVTPRTVYRWKANGKVEPDSRAAADSGPAGPDKHDNGSRSEPATNGRPPGKPETLAEAKRRKQSALAEKHEQEAARRRGELVTRESQRDLIVRFRSAAESIPRVLLQDVAELLDLPPREVVPMLEDVADLVVEHGRLSVEELAKEHGAEVDDG